jgi:outer membrane lipoprotein-sorting protein
MALVFLFFAIAFNPLLFAQTKEKSSSEILQEVTDKTKAYESIRLKFDYKMENPDANINETTHGEALVSGDKYQLKIAGQTVISDGKTVWTIIPDAAEVQVNNVSEGSDAFTPTKMLSSYNNEFKSKLIPKVNELNGKDVYTLELTPNKKKSFDKVSLFIDKNKMQLFSIVIYDQNGSTYSYTMTTFEPNVKITSTDFVFKATDYPGYEVIDMR